MKNHFLKLITLASLTFVVITPVSALPALEELAISMQGEAQGWVNATCTYYGLGWMKADDAKDALKRLMQLIRAHHLDHLHTDNVTRKALERDPGCKNIWPNLEN